MLARRRGVSIRAEISQRKATRAALGDTRPRALWKEVGWTSSSTSIEHEQDRAEREQDHTRYHFQLGVSRRPRQCDRAGCRGGDRLCAFQRRDLNPLLRIRAPLRRRCRNSPALAEHLFKIPAHRSRLIFVVNAALKIMVEAGLMVSVH